MRTILVLLALILFPALAFGQAEILTSSTATVALAPGGSFDPSMLSGIISALGAAFHDKDWSMLVGIILGALVLGARFIIGDLKKAEADRKIPKAAIPFIVAGLSLLGAVSVGLQLHQGAFDIIKGAALVAFVAVGGWEFASKGVEFLAGKIKGWFNKTPPPAPPAA